VKTSRPIVAALLLLLVGGLLALAGDPPAGRPEGPTTLGELDAALTKATERTERLMALAGKDVRFKLVEAYLAYSIEDFRSRKRIEAEEGRFLVHPFEGPEVATGTGTIGLEICEQLQDFDALIVPIGGGGLMAGIANAVRQLRPSVQIIGVEPVGANTMRLSFDAGEPRSIDRVRTIADSLGAPYAMPYSFELCRANVDRLVEVDDLALRRAMGFLFQRMKIAVEPACAAATATLMGPLREELAGRRVVLVFCGSNIDWATFAEQVIVED